MSDARPLSLPRRAPGVARVSYAELFLDLVYAFAVTQVSHHMLSRLSVIGAWETLVLWLAIWLGWQHACWLTNWFDPESGPVRRLLLLSMFCGLVMAASIPDAFGAKAMVFACAYVALQVGRTAYVVVALEATDPLRANYMRMLGWLSVTAALWLAGAVAPAPARLALWSFAAVGDYASPVLGFSLPGLGRSRTRDWTIEGGHLAERSQLFMIIALGETLLATGAILAEAPIWRRDLIAALLSAFVGALAIWWLYFGVSSRDASERIQRSDDPGRMGARLHYAHAVLIAGVIICAVGDKRVMAAPDAAADSRSAFLLTGGPALYLLGAALYKRVVYGRLPTSHAVGFGAFACVLLLSSSLSLLATAWLTTLILLAVAWREGRRPSPGSG